MKSMDAMMDAIYTAVAEMPSAPIDDVLDCVYGLMGDDEMFDTYEPQIRKIIEQMR